MHGSKVVFACIFNELQAVGLFLVFDGASMHTDHFTSGKKYRKLVNNAVFKCVLCFSSGCECIPIRAHTAVATQPVPLGLSNMDYRIWENY